jgi:hypothetical protein
MIVQIDIPDDAIKQDRITDNKDILNIIEGGFYFMANIGNHYHLRTTKIKLSIKE